MQPIFTLDGRVYCVTVPEGGLKRSGKVLDGDKAGRLQTGRMERDVIGTYYNYTMQVETKDMDVEEYDDLFESLSAPVDFHTVTVPYGQGVLTFEAYVASVDDSLNLMQEGRNLWGGLTFSFTAMKPKRTP